MHITIFKNPLIYKKPKLHYLQFIFVCICIITVFIMFLMDSCGNWSISKFLNCLEHLHHPKPSSFFISLEFIAVRRNFPLEFSTVQNLWQWQWAAHGVTATSAGSGGGLVTLVKTIFMNGVMVMLAPVLAPISLAIQLWNSLPSAYKLQGGAEDASICLELHS